MTFADLAREWTGTDRNTYGAEMQKLAEKYAAESIARKQSRERRHRIDCGKITLTSRLR